jgi:hypothetical protein
MNAVRIRRKLDSDTLHLSELKPPIGKNVEIIVLEEQPLAIIAGTGDWEAARKAVEDLEDCDFDAWRVQRDYDLKHARDHLP